MCWSNRASHVRTGSGHEGWPLGPGQLQDLLFDLWGAMKDTPAQPEVERWLTLTVERHLFAAEEVRTALTAIRDLAVLVPADSH